MLVLPAEPVAKRPRPGDGPQLVPMSLEAVPSAAPSAARAVLPSAPPKRDAGANLASPVQVARTGGSCGPAGAVDPTEGLPLISCQPVSALMHGSLERPAGAGHPKNNMGGRLIAVPVASGTEEAAASGALASLNRVVTRVVTTYAIGSPKRKRKSALPAICTHGNRRIRCKECKGSGICSHGRQRHQCKQCGGSSVCVHSRRRSECTACKGTSICPHGRRKSRCKECGGNSICPHGKRRDRCKECRSVGWCKHKRPRDRCPECKEPAQSPDPIEPSQLSPGLVLPPTLPPETHWAESIPGPVEYPQVLLPTVSLAQPHAVLANTRIATAEDFSSLPMHTVLPLHSLDGRSGDQDQVGGIEPLISVPFEPGPSDCPPVEPVHAAQVASAILQVSEADLDEPPPQCTPLD